MNVIRYWSTRRIPRGVPFFLWMLIASICYLLSVILFLKGILVDNLEIGDNGFNSIWFSFYTNAFLYRFSFSLVFFLCQFTFRSIPLETCGVIYLGLRLHLGMLICSHSKLGN